MQKKMLLITPQRPRDKLLVHKFPSNMLPSQTISVTINGVKSELWGNDGLITRPRRSQPKQDRQERSTILEMDFDQKVLVRELHVNMATAEVFLIGQIYSALILTTQILIPCRSALSTYYTRNGKNKLIHAYFQGAGPPFLQILRVLENYDQVLCVDTNSKINRNGKKVAVTTALLAKSEQFGEIGLNVTADHTIQVVSHDPPAGNPEMHGIWAVLRFLVKDHPQLIQGRIAIITDTEFSMVKAWNDRTAPFYDGHTLPAGVDIFYATADSGSEEFMPNLLMRTCDSLSKEKLREVISS